MPALLQNHPLSGWNTFGIAARARFARRIESDDELRETLADASLAALPRHVLGGGSNVLLTGDVDGLVLQMATSGRRVVSRDADAVVLEAAAGENWHDFVAWTLAEGYPGLENLALIPGSVGAAPVQNIGAYGLELAERFDSLRALDVKTLETVEFDASDCRFGYRDSAFKHELRSRYIIISVRLRLPCRWSAQAAYADLQKVLLEAAGTPDSPRAIFDAVVALRRAKLPDPVQLGNAGSFFKNPLVAAAHWERLRREEPALVAHRQADGRYKLAAAWLIDRCGWKGRRLGSAGVHVRQALVLVNHGQARAEEILELAAAIRADVKARFAVDLEMEPELI